MGPCFGCFCGLFLTNVKPRCRGYVVPTLRLSLLPQFEVGGFIRIMEKKMEATIVYLGYGFRV